MLAGKKRSLSTDSDVSVLHKEWDEALCPICIEHPHNAVLLLCSSHEKGCRPYICDTSYRHSNCLDRYRKLKTDSDLSPASLEMIEQQGPGHSSAPRSGSHAGDGLFEIMETRNPREGSSRDHGHYDSHNEDMEIADTKTGKLNLKCPLCRGDVQGLKVIEEARTYLNMKTRSCSRESCSFLGNYCELRRHARSLHPSVRPAEVDPSRQQAWSRFEHQREYDDIISAVESAIPGAVMFGDYVVENEDDDMILAEGGRASREQEVWATLLYIERMVLRSIDSRDPSRGTRSRNRLSSGRRNLWEENRLGTRYESDVVDTEDLNVLNDDFPARRRRRRLTRTRYTRDRH